MPAKNSSKWAAGILVAFIAGIAVDRLAGTDTANTSAIGTRLSAITEHDLNEYRELKGLREKYEKADELLGKVLLVLIADLGLKVTDENRVALENAARGIHPPAPPSTERAQVAAPIPTLAPALNPTAKSRAVVPQPLVSAAPNYSNVLSFTGMRVASRWSCDATQPGWFTSGVDAADDYRVENDGASASIQSLTSNPRGPIELTHCVDAASVRGKHVRFTAMIKGEAIRDHAFMRIRAENSQRQTLFTQRTGFNGTFDWKPYVVDVDVTAEAATVSYGLTFDSDGKISIRQPVFEITGPAR